MSRGGGGGGGGGGDGGELSGGNFEGLTGESLRKNDLPPLDRDFASNR